MFSHVEVGNSSTTPSREKELDCYPYTFSPLLLFAQGDYFDKGYSNYNSVAEFFRAGLAEYNVDMLQNVLFESANMRYEELLEHVTTQGMIVTCCIDNHFTAIQVVKNKKALVYYDPLRPGLTYVSDKESFTKFVLFLLIKCKYGDSQHVNENKDYYTGNGSNPTRKIIYSIWHKIQDLTLGYLAIKSKQVTLNIDKWLLCNNARNPEQMSTQETGNTCYFQTYLFAVLCKVCSPSLAVGGTSLDLHNVPLLEKVSLFICNFVLQFFVQECTDKTIMRPLTNSNFVLDFHRYEKGAYYEKMTQHLLYRKEPVPDYEEQYRKVMEYYRKVKTLHKYGNFQVSGKMSSSLNTKSLQPVTGTDDAKYKLCSFNYYKYRAINMMFGFNTGIMRRLHSFADFNSLRKNQLLAFYQEMLPTVGVRYTGTNKYKDYYFIAQFEIGQKELVDLHHYTYEIDMHALMGQNADKGLAQRVDSVNQFLVEKLHFSTQNQANYDKILKLEKFKATREFKYYCEMFMSSDFFQKFGGLGFSEINSKEKEINSLTQTVFYLTSLMKKQAYRMEYEFEKECINQMAKSTLSHYCNRFDGDQVLNQTYRAEIKIGHGYTYSKYNTLMHFLNVMECYWQNPDINSIQIFGKDIRTLLTVSCQKMFFHEGHTYYHYGPITTESSYREELDLQMANSGGDASSPYVSREKSKNKNVLIVTDRVYEHAHLRGIVQGLFKHAQGVRLKTDDVILNLALLSLLLDFGLYTEHAKCLNLPFLKSLKHASDTRQLQVEVSNWISEFDKANKDSVSRVKVEELIFEASYKFMVNKNFSVHSKEFELINQLNSDPVYHRYLLLCKVYISLCQINKSAEVDYYKIRCNNDYQIIIPQNYSKTTSDYLDQITKRYNFSERNGVIMYDQLPLFNVRQPQPEIDLYRIRFDSATDVQSMVKYIEMSNVFGAVDGQQRYLIFIADNILLVEVLHGGRFAIRINEIPVEIATIYFNEAISFVPCFKYADSEDVILFTSPHIHYLVDKGGQFNENYYGMKNELIEWITSEQVFVDLNDQHVFKKFKLSELRTESKTVVYFPDYLLQVQGRQQLINLLDYAVYIRNLSFFILVLIYLRRASVQLDYIEKDANKMTKITGPWREAILYVLKPNSSPNTHYDAIFSKQFFDLNQDDNLPLTDFIDVLCVYFTRYQRFENGQYEIVPRPKQKHFLHKIISSEECFHFSEVGSGKTKVILPLLCQIFLSDNVEAHARFARGGEAKHVLVILVPEHLVHDAQAQVYRYCLNLNFRSEYRIYDDIFALLHDSVEICDASSSSKRFRGSSSGGRPQMKQIFITSFNQFKKALTYDEICQKIQPHRERILVIVDELDDFLERDKLVFNICSNKNNDFKKTVLEHYFEVSQAAYRAASCPPLNSPENPPYWQQLHEKFRAIHVEIQQKSRSINKSFGIFNEQTLRHCSTNIAHDIEGYKSLIARPYESVNRAMPGSYYSDVERTIYLTYYILMEDIAKYDELFQQERKFISFEYFNTHIRHLDYDELVYGNNRLSLLVEQHPETKDGLARFLYEIILRRMEIRDKSRSVNSIDVVFNFDCIGFTGTPFIDNYPTFAYIKRQREDKIPDLIDRSFYVYSNDNLSQAQFEERFAQFQGDNSNVLVEYVPSEFIQGAPDELAILLQVFKREGHNFNVLVDLCGIFKKTSMYEVRDLVLKHFGADRFHYIYHIDQTDGSDRVLYLNSDNDIQFDEEFYKYLLKSHGAQLREKMFFFIDNRNVIGKDIPFQLSYQRQFGQPMFFKSVVLAHDVDDFSKIWQAMGRSRTMSHTRFAIYKNTIPEGVEIEKEGDIKQHPFTRQLYVRNCDRKITGNLSSIYQTIISLFNLAEDKLYYSNEIVNVFLDKMEKTIQDKVRRHEDKLVRLIFGAPVPSAIFTHILEDKCQKSTLPSLSSSQALSPPVVQALMRHLVQHKFEQRRPSGDVYDEFVCFFSGEQVSLMEVSYTKQQQKQKQKQNNKNQDSDTMEVFNKENQLVIGQEMENYFQYTLTPASDVVKICLDLPLSVPIMKMVYAIDGEFACIHVYPTLQFLYSNHIQPAYINKSIRELIKTFDNPGHFCEEFLQAAKKIHEEDQSVMKASKGIDFEVTARFVKQNPQYTLAAIEKGIYMIGMKNQFNIYDLPRHPLYKHITYVVDEMGFVLYDKNSEPKAQNLDRFGPYCIEQYIMMEVLSKQEVAQNVIDYYVNQKEKLQQLLQGYSETQGKGFICWRFIVNKMK